MRLLDFFLGVGVAAPAVDLRPAGDARLDAVAREIAVDGFLVEPRLGLGIERVRPRADQRQIAGEHDVKELRQFVEARLADEAADTRDAGIADRHQPLRMGVGLIVNSERNLYTSISSLLKP